ncbi:DNA recombination protein RmuC [soil metagenome]
MVLLIVIAGLIISVFIFLILKNNQPAQNVAAKFDDLQNRLMKIESDLKEDFKNNRLESATIAKDNRTELNNSLREFKTELSEMLRNITEQNIAALLQINTTLEQKVEALITKVDSNNKQNRDELTKAILNFSSANELQLDKINQQSKADGVANRETLSATLKELKENFENNIRSFNDLQREKFAQMDVKQTELVKSTETKLESIRVTVEEKLEKTLSERLGQSFETVGKHLIEVQKGLGEMQTLAQDVGGLKRVLSNVKMRGGFGEVQLHMMLESILAPEQYEANVATKKGSSERVEYAVKFPNKEGERDFVWLPIDAKFPKDAYEQLQSAYDTADIQQIENAQKMLEAVIKKMAKDICDKYLDAPGTTNFGIMFLPFEGLFAEVVRKASLLEQIQREYNVVITGPTTLAVILNSLQMGFRTLAIQKRSSEVWKTLSAVKKEFNEFGGLLEKAQKNIQTGLNQLDNVSGIRTRAIQRQLKEVETLENPESKIPLSNILDTDLIQPAEEE